MLIKPSLFNTDLPTKLSAPDYSPDKRVGLGGERQTWYSIPSDGYVQFYYLVNGLSDLADPGVYEYTCGIIGFINDGSQAIYKNAFHFNKDYFEEYWSGLYPVKKGDVVSLDVITDKVLQGAQIWFIPNRN